MLKFNISVLGNTGEIPILDKRTCRLILGESWFEPLDHPAIEHILMVCPDRSGRYAMIVRERVSATGFGRQVVVDASHNEVDAVLAETRAWVADFVIVSVDRGQVEVAAGYWGSSPIYLATDGPDRLAGSWDFLDLRDRLTTASLDHRTLARRIALQMRYSATTICTEITRLTERARARWELGKRLRIELPQPAVHYRPRELKDDAVVLNIYEELLREAVRRRYPAERDAVVELSGGTDSATVAIAARDTNTCFSSYGLLVGGSAGAQQVMRRDAIAEVARLSDVTVNALRYPPLAPVSNGSLIAPFEEPYRDALEAALRLVPQRTVLTGIGGDELFALRADERHPANPRKTGPECMSAWDCLTESARDLMAGLADEPDDVPRSVVPESALRALLVRAPVFLRAGRWPVSPLCDPKLIKFGEWLPRRWRYRKRLPRVWLVGRGVPLEVAWPDLPENFTPVMQLALRQNGLTQLDQMLRCGSVLAELGYVDPDHAAKFSREAKDANRRGEPIDVLLHEILALERELTALL